METTSIAALKARLSHFLQKVKGGHEVLITERGVAIAKIVPLERDTGRTARQERLAKAGLIRPGRGRVRKSLLTPPPGSEDIGAGVLAALIAEREEGR